MARNTAETVFTGNAADLLAAYQQVREANRQQEQQMREIKKANKEAHQEEQQSLREAARMIREVQTPLENYRQKVQQIEKAYESGSIDVETYNRQLRQQKELLDQSSASGTKASVAVGKFVSAFAGFLGVQTLIAGVRAEFEALRKLADDARLQNLDFAGVVGQTRNAFAADATLSSADLEDRLIKGGEQSRTSPKIFAAAMQDVFSAKGDATNEEAVQAAVAAFRLNPGDLESGKTLAARALDVRQATGSTDMLANIGFMQNLQQNARVTDLASVGKNLIPAVSGIMTRGDTAEQAGEFVTTLNTLMQDAKGEMTRTAAVSLSGQLRDFLPKAGSTTERLEMLQQDPKLAQKFLAGASFEQAATPFIEKMVTGSADALAVQADKRAKIRPLDAAQAADLERQIADKESSDRAQLLKADQESKIAAEVNQLSQPERAREGAARAALQTAFEGTNFSGPDALVEKTLMSQFDVKTSLFGQQPERAAIDILDREKGGLSEKDRQLFEQQIAILRQIADRQGGQPVAPAAGQGR